MTSRTAPDNPELRQILFTLYREFFDHAERKRRWSLTDDIPWDQVNPSMDPAIADVVASFCAVEMYLPDYLAKALPMIRANRGWASFHANWGYEESKHSLALGDWLLRSGLRTDEQMADLEREGHSERLLSHKVDERAHQVKTDRGHHSGAPDLANSRMWPGIANCP
jgi:acyl-[acyl-carrier protein] desaturase